MNGKEGKGNEKQKWSSSHSRLFFTISILKWGKEGSTETNLPRLRRIPRNLAGGGCGKLAWRWSFAGFVSRYSSPPLIDVYAEQFSMVDGYYGAHCERRGRDEQCLNPERILLHKLDKAHEKVPRTTPIDEAVAA